MIIDRSVSLPNGEPSYISQETYDGQRRQLDQLCNFVNDLRILVDYEPLDLPGLLDAVQERMKAGTPPPGSFTARQHAALMSRKEGKCCCNHCLINRGELRAFMILCPDCGNKRCPKASDHRLACTASNESGQVGSIFGPSA